MSLKLVMTDHDGVIMDSSERIYCAVWNLLSEHVSFGQKRIPSFSKFLQSFRLPGNEWFAEQGFDFPSERIAETLRRAPERANMFPSAPSFLARVHGDLKLPLIMVSAGDQERVEKQLIIGRVRHRFELVVAESRDKTMALALFCSAFDVQPTKAVYIGDMPSDMESGRAAGVTTIGFTADRPIMAEALARAGADHCVRDHEELSQLLTQLSVA